MDTIISGVYAVSGRYVNAYIIDGDEGVTLVDTLQPGREGRITTALRDIGRDAGDITAIVLTHSHADHAGGAAAMKKTSGAPLYASAADAPAIRGEERPPPPPFIEHVPLVSSLLGLMPGAEPAAVEHMIGESSATPMPEDLQVVDTPGHTPGHVSLLLDREGGLLFAGDAGFASRGEIKRGLFNRSTPQVDGSLRRIAEFDFERACFGHSGPIRAGGAAAFRRFVATLD